MKVLQKHEIIAGIPTMYDNEQVFQAIESIKRTNNKIIIFVWSNLCSDEFNKRLEKESDYLTYSCFNVGTGPISGFMYLYLRYKYFISTADDYVVPNNWWYLCEREFQDPSVGIVGEVRPENKSVPDCPLVIKREVIDHIGGIGASYGRYAHFPAEHVERAKSNFWKVIPMQTGVIHLGHRTVDLNKKNNGECFVEEDIANNADVWRRKQNLKEKWWI